MDLIKPSKTRRTMCEWKGMAAYHDLQFSKDQGPVVSGRIWSYPQPTPAFASIKDYLCFYASSQTDAERLGHWKCVRRSHLLFTHRTIDTDALSHLLTRRWSTMTRSWRRRATSVSSQPSPSLPPSRKTQLTIVTFCTFPDGSWITPEITGGDRGFKGGKFHLLGASRREALSPPIHHPSILHARTRVWRGHRCLSDQQRVSTV